MSAAANRIKARKGTAVLLGLKAQYIPVEPDHFFHISNQQACSCVHYFSVHCHSLPVNRTCYARPYFFSCIPSLNASPTRSVTL